MLPRLIPNLFSQKTNLKAEETEFLNSEVLEKLIKVILKLKGETKHKTPFVNIPGLLEFGLEYTKQSKSSTCDEQK